MKFTSALSAALLAGVTVAQDVACLVNGETVAVVDLDTGVCPFTIPETLPVSFEFESLEDYDVTFYYAVAQAVKYFTDIVNAGREIDIPAASLYGAGPTPLFQVHLEQAPAANSTAAIRKRLLKQVQLSNNELVKRAPIDDFLATAEAAEGTEVSSTVFEVVDISGSSSSEAITSSGDSVATETNTDTTVITITSCSDNKCAAGEVTATASEVTTTVDEEVTTYTTYCPETTVITITSCADDKCVESTVPVTPSLTTGTVNGEVTSYYTYCPLTESTETVVETTIITITSCSDDKCVESTVPATPAETTTTDEAGVESTYTTYIEVTSTAPVPETVAPETTVPETVAAESTTLAATTTSAAGSASPITTFEGGAAKFGASALLVAPLVAFLF